MDPAEAEALRVVVVQDFEGIAIEDGDDLAGEVGGERETCSEHGAKGFAKPYSGGLLNEMEKKNARIQTLEEPVHGPLMPKIDWVNNPGE